MLRQVAFKASLLLVALGLGMPCFNGCGRAPNPLSLPLLMKRLPAFRAGICQDADKTLAAWATPSARKKMAAIAVVLGGAMEKENEGVVWKWFFGTSVANITALDPATQLVGFYNPWSDLLLVTQWEKLDNKNPQITDAEILMGDFVRAPDLEGPPDVRPHWLRNERLPPPLSILFSTGQATRSFLELYQDAVRSPHPREWRQRIAALGKAKTVERNRVGAGLLFSQSLMAPQSLLNTAEHRSIREATFKTMALLEEDGQEQVLAGLTGLTDAQKADLRRLEKWWNDLTLASFVQRSPRDAFVFLSSFSRPADFVCFWFRGGSGWSLWRIDALSHKLSLDEQKAAEDFLSQADKKEAQP